MARSSEICGRSPMGWCLYSCLSTSGRLAVFLRLCGESTRNRIRADVETGSIAGRRERCGLKDGRARSHPVCIRGRRSSDSRFRALAVRLLTSHCFVTGPAHARVRYVIAALDNAVCTRYPSINAAAVDLDINTSALRALLSGASWPTALRVAELETRLGIQLWPTDALEPRETGE